MSHPRHELDDVIHSPVRFAIVAALAAAEKAEFRYIRDLVEIETSALSKQVSILEAAGYVKATKGYVGKRPRTWLSITGEGRAAFATHCAALRKIVEGV
ncbi:DNA-binding transcriptional regulator, MarR family [Nonomuraea maritima]|uniref:DNA-binding transcriptional regulator, MarR family n=1 Tax=Nonomuraea maritima TaxID=683260 RepID=A0A1G8Y3L4_9ACTN|nr:transcriptional regulator [Nonomuraea maritima]SDJ97412.1 DNA-binding transcriptional regulator, MarR family [Nonomuraea maritima]